MLCDFPKILSKLRQQKGYSQKSVAKDLGISPALLSHYEKGIRECGLDFIIRLAKYYDVSCDYLLGVSNLAKPEQYETDSRANAVNEYLKAAKIHNPDAYKISCNIVDNTVYRLTRSLCDNAMRSDTFEFDLDGRAYHTISVCNENLLFDKLCDLPKERKKIQTDDYKNLKSSIKTTEKALSKLIK